MPRNGCSSRGGIIREPYVRDLTRDLNPLDAAHIDFLNENILALLDSLRIPRCPSSLNVVKPPPASVPKRRHKPRQRRSAGQS